MADRLGIDYGNILAATESIKGYRERRKASEEGRKREENILALSERAAAGDKGAHRKLVGLDPARARQIQSALIAMTPKARGAAKEEVLQIGQISAAILRSPDPAAMYASVRGRLPPELQAEMPEQYDEMFLRTNIAMSRDALSLFDDLDAPDEPGGRELTSSDTNAIGRIVDSNFDGVFGPDGAVLLGGESGKAATAIKARASEIYAADTTLSHAQAAHRALEEAAQQTPTPTVPGATPELPGGFVLD